MKYLLGALVCWWKSHHIYGHKVKVSRVTNGYNLPYRWGYVCFRCGHIKEGAEPKKRLRKDAQQLGAQS